MRSEGMSAHAVREEARAIRPSRAETAAAFRRFVAAHEHLRVLFVADTFDGGSSGGTISGLRFVRALRERHDVVVLATGGEPGPDRVVLPGLQAPIRAMRGNGFTLAFPRRATIDAAIAKADVVHLQFPFWLSFAALASARRQGRPVVAAFHVQPENILRNVGLRSRRLSNATYRLWVNHLYNRANAVVCPTAFAEGLLRAHGLTTPSFVISNGVSPLIRRRSVSRDPRWGNDFVLFMVGRLAPEKRHDVMFEAIRRARHRDRIRLVIAGAGPRERDLRRRARALPCPVDFLGFVSDSTRLESLYNTADVLVHCSEVEIEGMAVLEAMSCGLPVLVADAPDSASGHFAVGPEFLFASGDPVSLAERIDHWAERPDALAAAREQVYRAAQSFSFETSVARLIDVYRRVAGAGRADAVHAAG
jgi:glycosyltransferase involved in cell wall biosynthesis